METYIEDKNEIIIILDNMAKNMESIQVVLAIRPEVSASITGKLQFAQGELTDIEYARWEIDNGNSDISFGPKYIVGLMINFDNSKCLHITTAPVIKGGIDFVD